jgi:AmmeMemoRadiSam system protein B
MYRARSRAAAAAASCRRAVLVLAPNHTGRGARGSVWPGGAWRLPGADVPVDAAFCRALCEESTLLSPDTAAHEDEHAIEVLVPLLAARQPALHLAPVVLSGLSFGECETLAAIARAVKAAPGPTLRRVVDYEPLPLRRRDAHPDEPSSRHLEALDGLASSRRCASTASRDVRRRPRGVALLAARALLAGARRARLRDRRRRRRDRTVVGYAATRSAERTRRYADGRVSWPRVPPIAVTAAAAVDARNCRQQVRRSLARPCNRAPP